MYIFVCKCVQLQTNIIFCPSKSTSVFVFDRIDNKNEWFPVTYKMMSDLL